MAGTADDERDVDVAFGVLGPLRVTRGGAAVPLGGRQQRAVLARLLLADGGGLSVEQLADALWGEHVPPGAATTIQTYVFRLRQALEPDRERGAPGRVVITDNGRYRLEVPPDGLDAAVFEQQLAAGQRHLAAGSPADAVTELDRALALWRGEVLADLADYEFVQPVAARLSDKRMAALEGKFTAELAVGRHAEVIGELDELVARYPLNEQLQRLRMIALYRCGRPSDALAAYDRLRGRLADELGADPSPPLQRLHQQLLTHDPALAWQSTDDGPPVATLPGPPSDEAESDVVRFGPRRIATSGRLRKRPWLPARWLVSAIVLVVAGAAAGITAVVVSQSPKHTLPSIPPNSVAIIDSDGAMHDAIPVGQAPEAITYGARSIWVTNSGDDTVMRINPKTHEVIQTIPVGSNPVGIAVAGTHVWVTNAGDGTVTEIDSTTNRVVGDPIRAGSLPDAIAANDQGAWVANAGDGTIVHIDAHTGATGKTVTVGQDAQGLALDGNTLWVSSAKDRIVSHINAATGDEIEAPKDVGAGAKGIAVTATGVWIANNAALSVTRIGRKGASTMTLSVGDGPDAVVATQGRIWVSDQYEPTVAVIDPVSARVLHRYATGSAVHGMTAVGSSLWVATQNSSGAGHRGGTLVVAEVGVPGDLGDYLDPPLSYITNEAAALRPVYDTLVAYRTTGGFSGLTLVPDLADSIPSPENGGRSYTFFLRPSLRYSTGATVLASDFRRGIARELIAGDGYGNPGLYFGILGARHCHDVPTQCDLRAGVDVDNQARRITFHLERPDEAFLYKLAILLAVPTPQDIPLTRNPRVRVPGTGPYKIAKYDGKSQLVLDRNPYFHQWSYAAQPDGIPDQITWKSDKTADAVTADVLAGRADIANPRDVSRSLIADLARNHLGQIHVQPTFGFEWVSLNVHTPPFDHAGVRQAFNYAIDRRAIANFYGGSLYATPTCQLLMPSFPAYQPYCPYATTQFEPNLSKAGALVAASGTMGADITVWAPKFRFYPQVADYLASVLRSLGYHAVARTVDRGDDTVGWLSDPHNRLQATTLIGWQADYPLPSTFFDDLVACKSQQVFGTTSGNRGGYCNQRLDSLINAAEAAEPTDPVSARGLWQEADRLAVDDAAIVPTVVQQDSVITSTRVRNVQNTPLDLPIFDQIWVR